MAVTYARMGAWVFFRCLLWKDGVILAEHTHTLSLSRTFSHTHTHTRTRARVKTQQWCITTALPAANMASTSIGSERRRSRRPRGRRTASLRARAPPAPPPPVARTRRGGKRHSCCWFSLRNPLARPCASRQCGGCVSASALSRSAASAAIAPGRRGSASAILAWRSQPSSRGMHLSAEAERPPAKGRVFATTATRKDRSPRPFVYGAIFQTRTLQLPPPLSRQCQIQCQRRVGLCRPRAVAEMEMVDGVEVGSAAVAVVAGTRLCPRH